MKEIGDEALQLRKLLQKYKVDIKQSNLSHEQSLSTIENMIKISTINFLYCKNFIFFSSPIFKNKLYK